MDDDEFNPEVESRRLVKTKPTKGLAFSTQSSVLSQDSTDTSFFNLDSNELIVTRSLTNKQYETLMFTPKTKNHVDVLITRGRYQSDRRASRKLGEKYDVTRRHQRFQCQKSKVFFVLVFIGLTVMLGVMVHVLVKGIIKEHGQITYSEDSNGNYTSTIFISDNKAYELNEIVIANIGKRSEVPHRLQGSGYGPGGSSNSSTTDTVT